MKTEDTNLLLLTISASWSSFRWPLATWISSRRQRSIPLGSRYIQVSMYHEQATVQISGSICKMVLSPRHILLLSHYLVKSHISSPNHVTPEALCFMVYWKNEKKVTKYWYDWKVRVWIKYFQIGANDKNGWKTEINPHFCNLQLYI